MRRAIATWAGVAGLLGDAVATYLVRPVVDLLQLVDDAHDTEGDDLE